MKKESPYMGTKTVLPPYYSHQQVPREKRIPIHGDENTRRFAASILFHDVVKKESPYMGTKTRRNAVHFQLATVKGEKRIPIHGDENNVAIIGVRGEHVAREKRIPIHGDENMYVFSTA